MVLEMRRMNGTIYTDLTGAFPLNSARGNKLLYIAYSYYANGILWEPMKGKNDSEMSRVFKIVYNKLEKKRNKTKIPHNGQRSVQHSDELAGKKQGRFTKGGTAQSPSKHSGTDDCDCSTPLSHSLIG